MPRYRYAIEENAATALLALSDAQITSLVAAFEALADEPWEKPDSYSLDAQGRSLANKIVGDCSHRLLVRTRFEALAHSPHRPAQ